MKPEMLQKLLLTVALVGAAVPALAQQQGTPQERAACATRGPEVLQVRK